MATVNGEVDIRATPQQILDVIADLAQYPAWSSVHKRASIDQFDSDGRPIRATMAVTAAGLTDEQVLDYEWTDHDVTWTLVKSGQQRDQHGSYAIRRASRGVSHVRYVLDITPAIPVPGFIVRQVMRKAVSAATDGLRKRVESLQEKS
ncbi:MAG: SRPBCC family protein [Actinomycetota bacterium]|nr:SRPBCC family protein [Actinomycetota bacterium]